MCCCCKSCNKKTWAKIGYVFFSLFWIIIAFSLLFTAKEVLDDLNQFIECKDGGSTCLGISATFRMSFVLMLFHLVVFFIALTRSAPAAVFHDGCWCFKFLVVFTGFVVTMFIPNAFFFGYGQFARIASAFFLIYQAFVMIVVAYYINDALVG